MVVLKFNEVKRLRFQIKILDEKIEELRNKAEIQAIKYSDLPRIKDCCDKILSLQMEKLIELEIKRDKLQTKTDIILEELESLPENVYKVAYYRIIDGLKWDIISEKLNYSVAQCRRFFNVAKNFPI